MDMFDAMIEYDAVNKIYKLHDDFGRSSKEVFSEG